MIRPSACLFTLLLSTTVILGAEKKVDKPIYIDPKAAAADPDFKVQGEYEGVSKTHPPVGAQIVAQGDGVFKLAVYQGGLPGKGWDGKAVHRADGKRTKNGIAFESTQKNVRWTWRDGKLAGRGVELHKVQRKSPTLGAKPPKGAIVLFDGKHADHWQKGKVDERGLLVTGCTTKKLWQSFKLHLEFRTPYKPFGRGQDRGNAGCYIQRRYEVQILDSFGLKGEANECGGLYRQKTPDVNMAFPPLTWQTYDIDFTAAKFDDAGKKTAPAVITVKHNGVTIHDNYKLKNKTGAGRKEGPEPGPIYLQGHGNPVFYRNIWIVEK